MISIHDNQQQRVQTSAEVTRFDKTNQKRKHNLAHHIDLDRQINDCSMIVVEREINSRMTNPLDMPER